VNTHLYDTIKCSRYLFLKTSVGLFLLNGGHKISKKQSHLGLNFVTHGYRLGPFIKFEGPGLDIGSHVRYKGDDNAPVSTLVSHLSRMAVQGRTRLLCRFPRLV